MTKDKTKGGRLVRNQDAIIRQLGQELDLIKASHHSALVSLQEVRDIRDRALSVVDAINGWLATGGLKPGERLILERCLRGQRPEAKR